MTLGSRDVLLFGLFLFLFLSSVSGLAQTSMGTSAGAQAHASWHAAAPPGKREHPASAQSAATFSSSGNASRQKGWLQATWTWMAANPGKVIGGLLTVVGTFGGMFIYVLDRRIKARERRELEKQENADRLNAYQEALVLILETRLNYASQAASQEAQEALKDADLQQEIFASHVNIEAEWKRLSALVPALTSSADVEALQIEFFRKLLANLDSAKLTHFANGYERDLKLLEQKHSSQKNLSPHEKAEVDFQGDPPHSILPDRN